MSKLASDDPRILKAAIFEIPFPGLRSALPAKEIVGSKAHNLMRMAAAGLPVPPGFVIGTEVCRSYLSRGADVVEGLRSALERELARLGTATGSEFGDGRRPLLVSVRSGAAVSMPGMMETVLNVGLNRTTLQGLIRRTGNPRLAADCRRRFVQQYGEVVGGIAPAAFARAEARCLEEDGAGSLDELDTAGLNRLADCLEGIFEAECGHKLPADPLRQITAAVEAVLQSWSSDRARTYRQFNRIPESLGTAVTVQAMVFGNLGPSSGSGVGFTRNPANGRNELYVDYLANAQGEDVVAGRRTASGLDELERRAPAAYDALLRGREVLEAEFNDMQDFEFTVEEGRLLFLQSRAGKRTPLAAVRIAYELAIQGLLTPAEALAQVEDIDLDAIGEERLRLTVGEEPLAQGTSAGSGVAVGAVVFDPARVAHVRQRGGEVILLRRTAETGEIEAISGSAALITVEGARTSHAAVVARQLGKPCIVGCGTARIDSDLRRAVIGTQEINEGDVIAVDGSTGEIYLGPHDVVKDRPSEILEQLKSWRAANTKPARSRRRLPG
jgi:pyruvate,orthophosphate dikinase